MPETQLQPQDFIETELQKFTLTDTAIAEMRANYLSITVADHQDKDNAKLARARRLEVKGLRVETEKLRKALKEDSLRFGKAVDAKARTIIKPLEEIEAHLQTQEDIVLKHAEREAEKERQRVAAEQHAERERLALENQRLELERQKIEAERAEVQAMHFQLQKQHAEIEAERDQAETIPTISEPPRQIMSTLLVPGDEYITIKAVYEASSDHLRLVGGACFLTGDALERFATANQIIAELTVRKATGAVVGYFTSSKSIQ